MKNTHVAFVFPGQGSQKVGMLSELAERHDIVRETFAQASSVVGYDMWDLVQNGEQTELNLTEKTQPIMLTSSVASWRVWCEESNCQPSLLAGHSLGEFSALVCAGALDFENAVDLVRRRGQFMQTAVPVGEGAMAAVLGLDDDKIAAICQQTDGVVEAVNYNSPGQVVIAGEVAAVNMAINSAKEAGAKRAMPLPVSAPFHTSMMKPAGIQLEATMQPITVNSPVIPVVHNVHAETEVDPGRIKSLLVEQISSPVGWVKCIEYMASRGIEVIVECGPGKVLSALNKRIDKSLTCLNIEDSTSLKKTLHEVQ